MTNDNDDDNDNADDVTLGRLYFPGSPWSNGHRIVEAHWRARVVDDTLVFHLHVCSADYDEVDADNGDDEETDEPRDDVSDDTNLSWLSPSVWSNYHRATISSDQWGANGFVVATADAPLVFAQLAGRTFAVDPIDDDTSADDLEDDDLAFNAYLLGHDTVADHAITFRASTTALAFDVDWRGRVALTYGGDDRFSNTFSATVPALPLEQISVVGDLDEAGARAALAAVLQLPDSVQLVLTDDDDEDSDDVVHVFRLR